MVRPVTPADILPLARYESERVERRRRIIELKKRRRVAVGPQLSFLFENHETVLHQIQEMLWAERISDPERIAREIATYNALLPAEGELAATLFIEITDGARVKADLDRFLGLDRGAVFLEIGSVHTTPAVFEEGHSEEFRISAVHYLRFPLTREAVRVAAEGDDALTLLVDLAQYQARTVFPPDVRDALRDDLRTG